MIKKQKENLLFGVPSAALFNQSILDVFVLQGILELEDAVRLKKHFKTNREIEKFLLKNHLVTKDTINKAYSIILKLPFVELKNIEISSDALLVIPEKIALKLGVIPFDIDGTLLKVAVTEPADLPLGFSSAIKKLFKNKKVNFELFITDVEDFKEAARQYRNLKKSLLIKKGSLPVVYLRNRKISRNFLNKIPKSFIEKYRLLVFNENIAGQYCVACEKPDSPLTKKILRYLEKENKIKLELFATSGSDIDYVLENYDSNTPFKIEELQPTQIEPGEDQTYDKKEKTPVKESVKTIVSELSKTFRKPEGPVLTIDSISGRSSKPRFALRKSEFQNDDEKTIINNVETDENEKVVSLVGKIPKGYLSKLPKEFITKYRIVVFGENRVGDLMLATDAIESETTQKAINFIKNQHPVEVFVTSTPNIEYAISIYE